MTDSNKCPTCGLSTPRLTPEEGQRILASMREKYGPAWPLIERKERLASHEAARNALKEAIGNLAIHHDTEHQMLVDQAITNYRNAVLAGVQP